MMVITKTQPQLEPTMGVEQRRKAEVLFGNVERGIHVRDRLGWLEGGVVDQIRAKGQIIS